MTTIRKRNTGFTLMELLIVLVIIGLLAALVGPTVYQRIKPAKQSAARAQIENFMTALDNFYSRKPLSHDPEGLKVCVSAGRYGKWKGPYLKKEIPDDPWSNPYVYCSPGRNGGYEIISYGADGREGER